MKANTHIFITRRSVRLRMRKISDELWRENQNTHFVFNDFFFSKNVPFMKYVGKYCRTGQPTDDNVEHADCMLDP